MRPILLATLLLGTLASLANARPNIIFFFVDDLGYGDIGCFWQDGRTGTQKFDTPHIDTMASEGAKMTHHYISASVCAPSRASLMQGRHQGHCDVRNSSFDKALPDNHTVSDMLQQAGYRTIHIGKSGLAGGEGSTSLTGTGSQNLAGHPLDRGFDEFFGYLFHADGHEHYPRNGSTDKTAHIYDGYQQVTNASEDLYTTDAWTAYAKNAIITEVNDGDDQPFFLYLAYETPHFKMQRPAVAYPAGGGLTGGIQWTTATDGSGKTRYATTADGTGSVDGFNHPDNNASWPVSQQQHVGMIRRIDNSIGDILQLLDDLDIDDNTLCIFSSDNGPHNEGHDPRYFESFANMEGIKRDMWEAGIRVPTVVRWPGNIAGATDDENNIHEIGYPSAIWDWMPTFAEMAEVPAPAWCDGVSILPTLTGVGTQRDKGYLYFEFDSSGSTPDWTEFANHRGDTKGEMQCVRVGDRMGVRTGISSGSEDFRVYDVTTDPSQATDLALQIPTTPGLPALQAEMKERALNSRRSGSYNRPYDSLPIPAVLRNAVAGLTYTAHEGAWTYVPEFRDVAPDASGNTTGIDLSVRTRDDDVGLLFTGFIEIPTAGSYTFSLTSDDGADLFIHNAHVIDDDFNHDGSEQSASIKLEAGLHPIRLYYRHNQVGTHALDLQWAGPGLSKQSIPTSAYFRQGPAPLALDDTATTYADTPVTIAVLANDNDDGAPSALSIDSFDQPATGTVTQDGDTLVYTPDGSFVGDETFNYTITDGLTTSTAEVTVTVLSADVAGRWSMEEGFGTTTNESVSSTDTDAFGPGVAWSLDTPGPGSRRSLAFPGTDDGNMSANLTAGDLGIDGSGAKTITGWIKTDVSFYGMFFGWTTGSAGKDLRLGLQSGFLRFESGSGYARYTTTALNDGQWHFVAVIIEPGDNVNSLDFYIDGNLVTPNDTNDRLINTNATGAEIYIGSGGDTGSLDWNGLADDIRVYDVALDESDLDGILDEMANTSANLSWGGAGSQGSPEFWNISGTGIGENGDPTHWNRADPPTLDGTDDARIQGGGIKRDSSGNITNGSRLTLDSGAYVRFGPTSSSGINITNGAVITVIDGDFDADVSYITIRNPGSFIDVVSGSFTFNAQAGNAIGLNDSGTLIVRSGATAETTTFFNSQNSNVGIGGTFQIDGGILIASGAEANPIRAANGLDGGGFDFTSFGGTLQIDNYTGAGTVGSYLGTKGGFFKIRGTAVAGFGSANEIDGEWLELTDNGTSGSLVLTTIAYDLWISGFDVGALTSIDDDPDFDGILNGIEFLLGGNPTVANDVDLPTAESTGGNFIFSFDRDDQAIGNLDVVIQRSLDLTTWPAGDNIVVGADTASSGPEVTITDNGATDQVVVVIPMAPDPAKYVRIRVAVPAL